MKPSDKTPEMDQSIDDLFIPMGFLSRREGIQNNTCCFCKKPAIEFKDTLSKKEFSISGLCQECQNSVFDSQE